VERRVYVKNPAGIFHHIENARHFQRKKLCFFLGQENATAFSLVVETPHSGALHNSKTEKNSTEFFLAKENCFTIFLWTRHLGEHRNQRKFLWNFS